MTLLITVNKKHLCSVAFINVISKVMSIVVVSSCLHVNILSLKLSPSLAPLAKVYNW